jgi:hypothetical protein
MRKLIVWLLPVALFLGCSDSIDTDLEENLTEVEKPEENLTEVEKPEENLTEVEQPEENLTEVEKPEENLTEVEQPEENLTEVEKPEENLTREIAILSCDEGYTDLISGDQVEKLSENAEVEIIHNQYNQKTICLLVGEAKIVREES